MSRQGSQPDKATFDAEVARRHTDDVSETRPRCMAARHDTSAAYKHDHCRCPQAVTEEKRRKTRAAALVSHVEGGIPPFHADPRRGCAELLDPDVMFPDKPEQVPVAKRVCAPCPFRRSCADWALQTGQLYGVWGGVTAGERRRQIAKRLEAVMS